MRSAGSYGVSLPLTTLAGGRRNQGRFAEAERDFRDALGGGRRADHDYSIAAAMGGLGRTLVESGQADAARPLLIEARERYEELAVTPGIVDTTIFLSLAERDLGDPYGAAQYLLEALTDVGNHWSDDAYSWTLQFAASIITDSATAAVLIGAVMAAYERSSIDQPVFLIEDLRGGVRSTRDRTRARRARPAPPSRWPPHAPRGNRHRTCVTEPVHRRAGRQVMNDGRTFEHGGSGHVEAAEISAPVRPDATDERDRWYERCLDRTALPPAVGPDGYRRYVETTWHQRGRSAPASPRRHCELLPPPPRR